jgi:hypothetical protein
MFLTSPNDTFRAYILDTSDEICQLRVLKFTCLTPQIILDTETSLIRETDSCASYEDIFRPRQNLSVFTAARNWAIS